MGVQPAACAVVEDSALGVRGARAADMAVCGFARDSAAEPLRAAGARVFREMAELPTLLDEIGRELWARGR